VKQSRAYKAQHRGSVNNQVDARNLLQRPGDIALVRRKALRAVVMLCPCGCGDVQVINLDLRVGPAWTFYQNRAGISLYPSVWRESGCESHFVVWNDRIIWFDDDWWYEELDSDGLRDRILRMVSKDSFVHFKDLAEELKEVPWSVLRTCRKLVRERLLVEGDKELREHFRSFADSVENNNG